MAVPSIIIITELIKWFTPIPNKFLPTIATVLGLFISIFISHPNDLPAGFFMGYFYGNAAVGGYAGMKTAILAYRQSGPNDS